ncbi:hypothetical protein TVAG_145070 [Trichomonas vaginalis G3]|uniref:Uncharacterized protein n=1 Tax=Trichomonas vaginalis (strain ATCC PRA-98 / G3) TaxID=412133 RepID=A2G0C4_TRIV3|nr:hypothetical protein TVAGG3_0893640 [Trichomonas vaginalis G3]EAX89399.1 hypothetical protein TVAG_145070 [Trichomonas vaginalis G3]KAI5502895.1 hypothetical protein TVAGG3_0893640 [Trichomonas vaginalis G3]|eukprot:XP_001302329.1 hypothetical protein [Trichomonas vaginalis G3]
MQHRNYYKESRNLEVNSELRLERLRSNLTNQYEKAMQSSERFEFGSSRKSRSKIKPPQQPEIPTVSRFNSIDKKDNSLLNRFSGNQGSPYFRKKYREADIKVAPKNEIRNANPRESILMSTRITLTSTITPKSKKDTKVLQNSVQNDSIDYSDTMINEQISKLEKELAYNNIGNIVNKKDNSSSLSDPKNTKKISQIRQKSENKPKKREIIQNTEEKAQKDTKPSKQMPITQKDKAFQKQPMPSRKEKNYTKKELNDEPDTVKAPTKQPIKAKISTNKKPISKKEPKIEPKEIKKITPIETNESKDDEKEYQKIHAVSLADDILHFNDDELEEEEEDSDIANVDEFFKNLMKKSEDIFARSNKIPENKPEKKSSDSEEGTPVPRKQPIKPSQIDSPNDYFHNEPKYDILPTQNTQEKVENNYYSEEEDEMNEEDEESAHEYANDNQSEEESFNYNKSFESSDQKIGESSEEIDLHQVTPKINRKSVIKSPTKEILDKFRKEKQVLLITPSNEQFQMEEEEYNEDIEDDKPLLQPLTREERLRMLNDRKQADEQLLNELLELGLNFEEEEEQSSGSPVFVSDPNSYSDM